jgi:hypothetical protein
LAILAFHYQLIGLDQENFNGMGSLLNLALDPLVGVIRLLELDDVVNLWMCGNKTINWKLGKGKAVRKIRLIDGKEPSTTWPAVIQNFEGLEILTVYSPYRKDENAITSPNLSACRWNLKSLSMNLPNAFEIINDLMTSSDFSSVQLETLKIASISDIARWDVQLPSSLTVLHVGIFELQLGVLPLSILPAGLIELKCFAQVLEVPEGVRFPPTLRKLDVTLSRHTPILSLLPQCLHTLCLSRSTIDYNMVSDEDWMALSRLELNRAVLPRIRLGYDPDFLQYLPKTIEELIFETRASELTANQCISVLKALAPLSSLRVLEGVWPTDMDLSVVQSMPPTLEMKFEELVYGEAVHLLPTNTKGLVCNEPTFNHIQRLPPHLQHLTVPYITEALARLLPPSLLTLSMTHKEAKLTEALINLLPRKLFSLVTEARCIQPFDRIESLKSLPGNLITLELKTFQDPEAIVAVSTPSESSRFLPPYLENLELGCLDFSSSDMADWCLGLPRSLTSITLLLSTLPADGLSAFQQFKQLHSLDIEVISPPTSGWSQHLAKLPAQLGFLALRDASPLPNPSNITSKSFQYELPHLNWLLLPESPLLDEECLNLLPELTQLYMGNYSSPEWAEEALFRRCNP